MVKLILLIGTIVVIFIAVFLYNSNQFVTYEVDSGNICEGGQTTLAPRQTSRVVIKKIDEAKFIEDSIKEKKCFGKVSP